MGRLAAALVLILALAPAARAQEPELIFKKSTVWKMLTPDDKLATYVIDDPGVQGVSCYYTVPERGGVKGLIGVAEETSDVSLACRQVGPIAIREKFEKAAVVFRQSRSLIFKKMQIVRGCDLRNNVLVYLVWSTRSLSTEGSPFNSVTAVPLD